jgi:hypothetical protein
VGMCTWKFGVRLGGCACDAGVSGGAVGAAEGVAGGMTPLFASTDSLAGFHFGKELVEFLTSELWRSVEVEEERGVLDTEGRLWEEGGWRGGEVCEE